MSIVVMTRQVSYSSVFDTGRYCNFNLSACSFQNNVVLL